MSKLLSLLGSLFDSSLFWGFVTFVLAAVALSGKFSMKAANVLLFIAWLTALVGVSRWDYISTWHWIPRLCVIAFILSLLGLGGYALSIWLEPTSLRDNTLSAKSETEIKAGQGTQTAPTTPNANLPATSPASSAAPSASVSPTATPTPTATPAPYFGPPPVEDMRPKMVDLTITVTDMRISFDRRLPVADVAITIMDMENNPRYIGRTDKYGNATLSIVRAKYMVIVEKKGYGKAEQSVDLKDWDVGATKAIEVPFQGLPK